MYIVQRTSFQLQTKNPTHCTKYTARSTMNTAHCTLHQKTLHKVQSTLHQKHCTLHEVHCTLYEAQCTLHIARRSKMQFDFKHCHDTLYSHLGIVLLLQGRSHNPPIAFLRQLYGYILLSRRDIF